MPKLDLVPIGVIFTYDTKFKDKNRKTKFYFELYGYNIHSKFSKYNYRKKGLLDSIKYVKPTNSTIIVKINDAKKLSNFFKKYRVKFTENIAILHDNNAKKLKLLSPNKWRNLFEDLKGSPNLLVTIDF